MQIGTLCRGQHFPRHIPRQFLCSLGLARLRAGMRVIGVENRTHGVGAVAVLALVARGMDVDSGDNVDGP